MKSVNIAKFKAELSKYLNYIRHGEEVIVLDRAQPIAKIIPFKPNEAKISFEAPQADPQNLINLRYKPIKNIKRDSLQFLLEERGDK